MILIPWSNGSKFIHVVLSNWWCTIQTTYCIWYQHKMHVLLQKQRFSEFAIICWEPVWKLLIDLILSWYQFDIVLMSDLCKIYKKNRPGINFKFTDLYIGPRIFALYMYMQCERKIISHHRVPRSHDYRIWALNDDKARHKICRTHTVPVLLLKLLMLNHMH